MSNPKLFISYKRQEEEFARQLSQTLKARGLAVWIDVDEIHAGDDWQDTIQEGLDQSDILILIVTPAAMESKQVSNEWKYFNREEKLIIPVIRQNAKLHYQLASLQQVDFENRNYNEAVEQLIRRITRTTTQPSVATASIASEPVLVSSPEAKQFAEQGKELLWQRSDYSNALEAFNRAIELGEYDAEVFRNRGECHRKLEHYDEAIQDFNRALALNPNYSYVYNSRGRAYEQLGNKEQAKRDFCQALRLDPNNLVARGNLERNRWTC